MGFFNHDDSDEQQAYETVQREGSTSHEVVAAAASYLGMRAYMKRQEAEGKPESYETAKEIIAAMAGAEADKLIETKGLSEVDRMKARHQAQENAKRALSRSGQFGDDQSYGGGQGQQQRGYNDGNQQYGGGQQAEYGRERQQFGGARQEEYGRGQQQFGGGRQEEYGGGQQQGGGFDGQGGFPGDQDMRGGRMEGQGYGNGLEGGRGGYEGEGRGEGRHHGHHGEGEIRGGEYERQGEFRREGGGGGNQYEGGGNQYGRGDNY